MKIHTLQAIRVLIFCGVFMLCITNHSNAQTGEREALKFGNLHDYSEAFMSDVQKGDIEAAKAFLEAGIPIETQDKHSSTVLFPRKHLLGTAVFLALFEEFAYDKTMAFSNIATALTQPGQTRQAEAVLRQAREFTMSITDTYHQSRGLSGIAFVLTDAGNIREALDVILSIPDPEERAWELPRIIPLLAETGDVEKARDVVQLITAPKHKNWGLRDIAGAFAEAGDIEKAREMLRTIEDEEAKALALSDIAIAIAKQGDLRQAETIVKQAREIAPSIPDASAKVRAFVGIAHAFVNIGNDGQAEAALTQAREAVGSIDMAFSQILSLRRIAQAYADMGKPVQVAVVLKQAQEAAESTREADTMLRALRHIAETFADAGDSKHAEAALIQAQELALSIEYVEPKTQSLGTIAKTFAEIGNLRQAEAVLHRGIEAILTRHDDHDTMRAFSNIAVAALSIDFTEAQQAELANTLITAFLDDTFGTTDDVQLSGADADLEFQARYRESGQDLVGGTALIQAAGEGHTEIVKLLRDAGANIEAPSSLGTALIEAAGEGQLDVVKLLLDAGANINAVSPDRDTAFMRAKANGHTEIVTLLSTGQKKPGGMKSKEPAHFTKGSTFTAPVDEAKQLLEGWRPSEYIENDFDDRGDVVVDRVTGLMWQKSGSGRLLTYEDAHAYIKTLNRERFAGYEDWRLPTIEELASLLEPEKQALYLNPFFDTTQTQCWSADRLSGGASSGPALIVSFNYGNVDWCSLNLTCGYARAVRNHMPHEPEAGIHLPIQLRAEPLTLSTDEVTHLFMGQK